MESTEAGPSTPDLVAGEEGVSGADDRGEHAEAAGSSAVLAFEEPTVVEGLVTFCIVLVAGASAACGCFIHP